MLHTHSLDSQHSKPQVDISEAVVAALTTLEFAVAAAAESVGEYKPVLAGRAFERDSARCQVGGTAAADDMAGLVIVLR